MDKGASYLSRPMAQDHRCRDKSVTGAAPDTCLVRGSFRTCYETLGSNWRWLVSSKVRPRRKVGREKFEQVRTFAREAGRDPNEIGFEPRIAVSDGDPDTWSKDAAAWKELGATHLSVNTMGAGIKSPQGHIDAIIRFKEAIGMI